MAGRGIIATRARIAAASRAPKVRWGRPKAATNNGGQVAEGGPEPQCSEVCKRISPDLFWRVKQIGRNCCVYMHCVKIFRPN